MEDDERDPYTDDPDLVRYRALLLRASGDVELPAFEGPEDDVYGDPPKWAPPRKLYARALWKIELPSEVAVYSPGEDGPQRLPMPFVAGEHEVTSYYDPRGRLGGDGLGAFVTQASAIVRRGAEVVRWEHVYASGDDNLCVLPAGVEEPGEVAANEESLCISRAATARGDAIFVSNPSGDPMNVYAGVDAQGAIAALFVQHY